MYSIQKISEDKILVGRISDDFWLTLKSKDFSLSLLDCQLLTPYKIIRCKILKIELRLMKMPKDFQEIPFDLLVKSDDYITFKDVEESKVIFDKILIHEGCFYTKKQNSKKSDLLVDILLPDGVQMVDGLPQYQLPFNQ